MNFEELMFGYDLKKEIKELWDKVNEKSLTYEEFESNVLKLCNWSIHEDRRLCRDESPRS